MEQKQRIKLAPQSNVGAGQVVTFEINEVLAPGTYYFNAQQWGGSVLYNNSAGTQTNPNMVVYPEEDYVPTLTGRYGYIYDFNIKAGYKNTCLKTPVVATVSGVCQTPVLSVAADKNNVCEGTEVTFTATLTNGSSSPVYVWKVNGTQKQSSASPVYKSSTLKEADVVEVSLVAHTDVKDQVTLAVNSTVTPTIKVQADKNTICLGEQVTFLPIPTNEGSAPTYDWLLNGTSTGVKTASYSSLTLANNDKVSVILTSSEACVAGPITSAKVTIKVGTAVTPAVSITANKTTVCKGEQVTSTATPVNGGVATYKWYVGAAAQAETSNKFTYTPSNGDVVKVEMTSSLACATTPTVVSNGETLTVNPLVTPSVNIAANKTTVCKGEPVTSTATPVNGGAATYKWYVGTVAQVETSNKFTYTPSNGDVVKVEMTSSLACTTTPTVTSSNVSITVNPVLIPSITAKADKNTICPGEKVSFSSQVTNGGGAPVYDWLLNGTSTGVQAASYSNSALSNNDKVSVTLTSSEVCVSGTVTSTEVVMQVGTPVTPSVSIVADNNSVCEGTPVTMTATPVNGGVATYKWFVGTTAQAETTNKFTYTPSNGDIVKVEMTTGLTCVTKTMAVSNEVKILMTPAVVSSVSIVADQTTVCEGTPVTIEATAINAGVAKLQMVCRNSSTNRDVKKTYLCTIKRRHCKS